jgi:hypothetical protein
MTPGTVKLWESPSKAGELSQLLPSLPHGLKEQNGGGPRDIQGIHLAGHGHAYGPLVHRL